MNNVKGFDKCRTDSAHDDCTMILLKCAHTFYPMTVIVRRMRNTNCQSLWEVSLFVLRMRECLIWNKMSDETWWYFRNYWWEI